MTKHGPVVYVDFYQINRPCTCIVSPSFVGELLVTLRGLAVQSCNTEINVQNSILFRCPINVILSQTLNVILNQLVNVRADYVSPSTSGTFYHCLGFLQNGMNVFLSIFGAINNIFCYVVIKYIINDVFCYLHVGTNLFCYVQ